MLDIPSIRNRFPALQRQHDARPVIVFDNPAGTQVPLETIDATSHYLLSSNANEGGAFVTSRETDTVIATARQAMADFLNAASPREIVFGQNMTSLTYQLSHALGRVLKPGDEIVTTRLEHDANVSPWLALQERGIHIKWIDIHPEDATLDLEHAETLIGERTRLVAVGYASNALGTINDVRRIVDIAHAHDAWVFVDAVHYGPHGPIDVQALDCDLLVCSAYKFFGPHIGILYGRYDVLESLPADHVRPAGTEPPDTWETGTQSHESLAGLLGTITYLRSLSGEREANQRDQLRDALTRIKSYEHGLSERLFAGLQSLPGVKVYGITDPAQFDWRVPTASFTIKGVDPYEGSRSLAEHGIFSWAGNHYAVEPLNRLGIQATQRIGLVHYNTADEIDRFLNVLGSIVETHQTPVWSPPA